MSELEVPGLVSVIIPSFKMGKFIGEALASIGAQTYSQWEVLVVDDSGPEDGTRAVVEGFARQFPQRRVEFIRHEHNQGVSAARNTAIRAAGGQWLAFLDPDDVWFSAHLATHVQMHQTAGQPCLVTASVPEIFQEKLGDQRSQTLGYSEWETRIFPNSLAFGNRMNPSSVVLGRKCLETIRFDESPEMQHVEDWDLWFNLVAAGALFQFSPAITVGYRRHGGSATANVPLMRKRLAALAKKNGDKWLPLLAYGTHDLASRMDALEQQLALRDNMYSVRVERWCRQQAARILRRFKLKQ